MKIILYQASLSKNISTPKFLNDRKDALGMRMLFEKTDDNAADGSLEKGEDEKQEGDKNGAGAKSPSLMVDFAQIKVPCR